MRSPLQPLLLQLRRLSRLGLFACLVLGSIAWNRSTRLPEPAEILPDTLEAPLQTASDEQQFAFDYRGSRYLVEPVADYELHGLIVTHNDIEAFADIYHDENSVDVRDLCVIWGENLESDIFRRVKFWSEPWSCVYHSDSMALHRQFRGDQLSNNHLLASNETVRQAILSAEVGDQIALRGKLVNYSPESRPDWKRKSSTVREDRGNGACEVIFVDEFQVLHAQNSRWRALWALCLRLGMFLLGLEVVLLFAIAHADAA